MSCINKAVIEFEKPNAFSLEASPDILFELTVLSLKLPTYKGLLINT